MKTTRKENEWTISVRTRSISDRTRKIRREEYRDQNINVENK